MRFGKCSDCSDYKMLLDDGKCRSCTYNTTDMDKNSFYEIGIKGSDVNSDIDSMNKWFDETIPFQDYNLVKREWLIKPFCYSTIAYSKKHDNYWYIVREPEMTMSEKFVLDSIRHKVKKYFESNPIVGSDYSEVQKERIELIKKGIKSSKDAYGIDLEPYAFKKFEYYLSRDIVLYDKVTGIMMDPRIESISYQRGEDSVTVDHNKYARMPTTISFSPTKFDSFIRDIAKKSGKSISTVNPEVEAELQDGSKVKLRLGGDYTVYKGCLSIKPSDDYTINF